MSSNQHTPDKGKGRLPAPSLFRGPPSHNASNVSLLPPTKDTPSTRNPLSPQQSLLPGDRRLDLKADQLRPSGPNDAPIGNPFSRRDAQQQAQTEQQTAERTEAIWAEMQNTLEEVELSAGTGTHVFGPHHSQALEELRTAQIALAQAWAKSEAEEDELNKDGDGGERLPSQGISGTEMFGSAAAEKAGTGAKDVRERSGTDASTKSQLEEETEKDIALARKRREANDRYFRRVNAGVLDVVQKLEEVAKAMKGVELESKEIWGDNDSIEGSVA